MSIVIIYLVMYEYDANVFLALSETGIIMI